MNRPANFNDLPVEERTMIIQQEITKIEQGKSHNTHTMKRIRNRRLEIHNLMNPDVEALSYSQSEHESNVSGSSKSKSTSNVSEHGSSSNVHSSDVSDVIVNASTGLAVFNEFLDDPEVPNYKKIDYFKERYLYLQNSKFF